MSHHHSKAGEHQHHPHHAQQMGALRAALEHAGRSVRSAEGALEKAKSELLAERLRKTQMIEQCERAIAALQALRDENKRLRTLLAEKGTKSASDLPQQSEPTLPPPPPEESKVIPFAAEAPAVEIRRA
ncbi:MAG: hypothetical protein P4L99_09170 [Chthoniobacter sp.]|nr:hypothetical protein [Chthoniobacter sp.]